MRSVVVRRTAGVCALVLVLVAQAAVADGGCQPGQSPSLMEQIVAWLEGRIVLPPGALLLLPLR
jgi:hypothetical protein